MPEIAPESLLIGVAAHISRLEMAQALADETQAQVFNVDKTHAVERESKLAACAANHLEVLRQLQAMAVEPTWCIVLEDDALPIKNFRIHAAAALQHAPSPLAGFYIGRAGNVNALQLAYELRRAWVVSDHMVSAVAYAVRTDMMDVILADYPINIPTATPEERFTRWVREHRWQFCYTVPSLVDHSDGESLIFSENNTLEIRQIRRAWLLGAAAKWDTTTLQY